MKRFAAAPTAALAAVLALGACQSTPDTSGTALAAAEVDCVDPAVAQEKAAEPPGVTQAVGGAVAATAGQAAGAAVAGPIGAAIGGAIAGVLGNRTLAKKAPKPCPPLTTAQAAEPEGGASTTPMEPESGQTPPAEGEPPPDPAPAQQPAPTPPQAGPNV